MVSSVYVVDDAPAVIVAICVKFIALVDQSTISAFVHATSSIINSSSANTVVIPAGTWLSRGLDQSSVNLDLLVVAGAVGGRGGVIDIGDG